MISLIMGTIVAQVILQSDPAIDGIVPGETATALVASMGEPINDPNRLAARLYCYIAPDARAMICASVERGYVMGDTMKNGVQAPAYARDPYAALGYHIGQHSVQPDAFLSGREA